jgi:hypothetical protein
MWYLTMLFIYICYITSNSRMNVDDKMKERFESLTATECNEISGDHPCDNGISIQCFGDCLCFHHQG